MLNGVQKKGGRFMSCILSDLGERGRSMEIATLALNTVKDTVSNCADTAFGVIGSIFNVATLGLIKDLNQKSCTLLGMSTRELLVNPAEALLKILDKKAVGHNVTARLNGGNMLGDCVQTYLTIKAFRFHRSDSFCVKQIASRFTYLAAGVLGALAKVVDLIVGLVALVFSLATFGQVQELNNCVHNNLSSVDLINTLFRGVLGFLRPAANG